MAAEEHFIMDAAHSVPTFEFKHLGLTTQTGRFDRAHGTVTIDRKARSGRVDYEVDTTSLNMGVGTETPESPGYLLFDVKNHPHIVFTSRHLHFDASGAVVAADGELTLLGVTRPLSVNIGHFACGPSPVNGRFACAGDITADLKRSEFGMLRYIPGISDEIHITVPVEAYRSIDP